MLTAFIHCSPSDRANCQGSEPHTDNWLIEECTIDNVDALLEYNNQSGQWQDGRPAKRLTFLNVTVTGLAIPMLIIGDLQRQFHLLLENVDLQFRSGCLSQPHINARDFDAIELRHVTLRNDGQSPLVNAKQGNYLMLEDVKCLPTNNPTPFLFEDVNSVKIL